MDHSQPTEMDNSWDSSLYDDAHSFVYEHGEDLVDLLEPREDELVLDLGCGTGHLTQRIAERGADVVGVDHARDMLVQARDAYADIHFARADGRQVYFAVPFDAVFSNAVLHWVPDPGRVIECVRDALGEGGRFVAEFGGKGNVDTIVSEMAEVIRDAGYDPHNPWYFPSIPEYTGHLEQHGFETRYARLFDRPTKLDGEEGLRDWLAMFTDSFFSEVPAADRERLVGTIEDRLRPDLYDPVSDVWIADYRRIRIETYRK